MSPIDRDGNVLKFPAPASTERKIIRELHAALDLLDAPVGYLAAMGSFLDTAPPEEVLRMLESMNETTRAEVGRRMDCYIAENNDSVSWQLVKDMGAGAGRTRCFECEGTGTWPWHPDGQVRQCADCKGTGTVYVSI